MKKLTNKKGFTLVELLVVVAIIAILMLIAIPRFLDSTKGAKIKTFEGNFRTVLSSIAQYQANHAGSTKGISGVVPTGAPTGTVADESVKKLVASIANKPSGATYELAADESKFTAKLKKEEINEKADYELIYTMLSGDIEQKGAPAGAANFQNK